MTNSLLSPSVNEYQLLPSGILFQQNASGAPTLKHNGRNYIHFVGGIYMPAQMHELSLAQLQDVNRLRHETFSNGSVGQKNYTLKKLFAETIEDHAGDADLTVVDLGCGTTPVMPYFNKLHRYIGIDIDPNVVQQITSVGLEGYDTAQLPQIKLPANGLAAFVALYSFQWHLGDDFFSSVVSLMRDGDIMLANLYRIPDEHKSTLRARINATGLHIAPEIADTKMSPGGRQSFWAISKQAAAAEQLAERFESKLAALPDCSHMN